MKHDYERYENNGIDGPSTFPKPFHLPPPEVEQQRNQNSDPTSVGRNSCLRLKEFFRGMMTGSELSQNAARRGDWQGEGQGGGGGGGGGLFLASLVGPFLMNALTCLLHTHLYPKAIFQASTYINLPSHRCRHPEVQRYLNDSVRVAAAAIGEGGCKGLVLEFYCERSGQALENFVFTFMNTNSSLAFDASGAGTAEADRARLESGFRDILLKIVLQPPLELPSSTTFRVLLLPHDRAEALNGSRTMGEAIRGGGWMREEDVMRERGVIRPLKGVKVESVGLVCQVYHERYNTD